MCDVRVSVLGTEEATQENNTVTHCTIEICGGENSVNGINLRVES